MHVVDGFAINREEAAGGAIFRTHIADGCSISQRHALEARAEELDELADDALLAQHLNHRKHEIGRRYAFLDLAGQAEADDLRQKHGNRLAQHGRFRFDAANAPAQNAKAVDHGRVRISANAGIGIGDGDAVFFLGPDCLGQIFKVDLMADARARRNDAEILERLLAPLQEAVTFAIALIFEIDIALESLRIAELVNDHRVIDNQINRDERIDLFRVAAKVDHGIAHCCKVHDGRNASKVLHENTGWAIGNFSAGTAAIDKPFGDVFDVLLENRAIVFKAKQVFEEDFHGEGELGNAFQAIFLSFGQAVIDIFLIPYG